ncbi:hypothetical protein [Maricaulis sp.]|uniref:hypothetical protein n=1 Tax=Maricaulis sp. TaxID=1486257 RepID=UPI0025BA3567|nr:hypothetical protein [Maricaulis sp.]
MALKFEADIRRDAVCAACGTGYYYFHSVEVNGDDREKFDAKVRKAVEEGVGVAPCPACGELNPEMKAAHGKALQGHLIGIAVSLAILAFGWLMLEEGLLLYILLPVGGLSLLGYLGATIAWMFEPKTNRKHSIIPGRESEASDKAREKLAAWQARTP